MLYYENMYHFYHSYLTTFNASIELSLNDRKIQHMRRHGKGSALRGIFEERYKIMSHEAEDWIRSNGKTRMRHDPYKMFPRLDVSRDDL